MAKDTDSLPEWEGLMNSLLIHMHALQINFHLELTFNRWKFFRSITKLKKRAKSTKFLLLLKSY